MVFVIAILVIMDLYVNFKQKNVLMIAQLMLILLMDNVIQILENVYVDKNGQVLTVQFIKSINLIIEQLKDHQKNV
jgi:hypothetical protein